MFVGKFFDTETFLCESQMNFLRSASSNELVEIDDENNELKSSDVRQEKH